MGGTRRSTPRSRGMPEPPFSPPRPAGDGEPHGLLATKLHVPSPRPGLVPRPRLVAQLDERLAAGLVLVSAPAGFGKTSLLAEWARHGDRPVAWLSLDPGDNDPARFWRYLAAAMDRVRPGIAVQIGSPTGPPSAPALDGLAMGLINALVAQPHDEVVLVLDDYHLIEAQSIHASLVFLVEHRPPELAVVLATRSDPLLPLARLRARGELAEIRAADLRFTTQEAAALLREAVGSEPALPGTTPAILTSRTEGWAAGLQLAALSLRGRPDVDEFLRTFSGSHRHVLDFLTEEVLERQPEPVRLFMLETSVLERLSGDLCDAVIGRSDGQRMLEAVERANLFLVPLDDVRGWWRYHHLFADLLRARLAEDHPQRATTLHRKAGVWFEQHDLPDDAIRHALAADDTHRAARLIEQHVDALLLRSEAITLERWFSALPTELEASRPRLLLARARLALLSGRVQLAVAALDAAERAMSTSAWNADEAFEPSVGRASSLLANVPATIPFIRAMLAELDGDAESTHRFASDALVHIDDDEPVLDALIRGHLAIAEWLRGRVDDAEDGFRSTISRCQTIGEPSLAAWASHHLVRVQRARGNLDAALHTCRQTLQETAPADGPPLPAAGVAHAGMAAISYQQDEIDAALRHATDAVALCRRLAYTPPLASALVTLAWARHAGGDPDGALDAIEEAHTVAPSTAVADLLNPVPAERARLLLAVGDVDAAVRWADERGLRADDQPTYARESEYLVFARLLLAQGRPSDALALLGHLRAAAADQERAGSLIEIKALQALALAATGEDTDAIEVLADALQLAHPQRWMRVFADEGRPMGNLLAQVTAARHQDQAATPTIPSDYLDRLVHALEPRPAAAAPQAGPPTLGLPSLIEPLSQRELEVLELLAQGKTNKDIASELYVATDTIKKHVTHILDKLGAANRTQAAVRARQHGLLR